MFFVWFFVTLLHQGHIISTFFDFKLPFKTNAGIASPPRFIILL